MRKALFGLFGLAALAAAGFAWAQGIIPLASPVGTELLTVYPLSPTGGLGGGQAQVDVNNMRNTTGYLISSATTGTVTLARANNRAIFIAALTGNITLNVPPNPPDGQMFEIVNGTTASFGANTITPTSTDGSTFVNGGAITLTTPGGSVEFQYTIGSKVWYRLR
jgi:hypothetical protein